MNRLFVKLDHVPNPSKLSQKANEKGARTLFITFCMHATGIYRLFSKEGVGEFFWRLAIMFRHYNVVPKFFMEDKFIGYDDRGVQCELCLADIIEHLGLELSDSPIDFVPREKWADKIETYWKNATLIGVFTGIPILDQRVIGRNQFIIGSNVPTPITQEFEQVADVFAEEAIKTIGDERFKELALRVADRVKSLEKYREFLATPIKHTFEYLKIPIKVRKRIYSEMYPNFPLDKYNMIDEINDPDSTFATLIHLAWLWVNGFVIVHEITMGDKHAYTAEVDERVKFDYEKYDGLNRIEIGVNIYDTYYEYELDKIAHYLKEE